MTTVAAVREAVAAARRRGLSIGCVPTMGALHAGHGALMERARAGAGLVVVTIFVNPIQFDRKEDYQAYATSLEADREFCAARDVDVVFAPAATEMYPTPIETSVTVPDLARHLCGAFRPGHFEGVATVVAKLFNIVQPDIAWLGQKDLQQLAVIRQMVSDLNFPVTVIGVATVREADGLALSSRNARLSTGERKVAPTLFRALCAARQLLSDGEKDAVRVCRAALDILGAEPAIRVEYLEVVDSRMQPVAQVSGPVWIAAAVWLGSTRLIDNVAFDPGGLARY
jgi:pantoate--beta-alanine ligase